MFARARVPKVIPRSGNLHILHIGAASSKFAASIRHGRNIGSTWGQLGRESYNWGLTWTHLAPTSAQLAHLGIISDQVECKMCKAAAKTAPSCAMLDLHLHVHGTASTWGSSGSMRLYWAKLGSSWSQVVQVRRRLGPSWVQVGCCSAQLQAKDGQAWPHSTYIGWAIRRKKHQTT